MPASASATSPVVKQLIEENDNLRATIRYVTSHLRGIRNGDPVDILTVIGHLEEARLHGKLMVGYARKGKVLPMPDSSR